MSSGTDPRLVLGELLPKGAFVPHNVDDGLLWRFILNLLSEPKRTKLAHINTLDDVVHLLNTCTRIIVLTGAGVSVSCGIPDFRSRDGIYARLSKDYPDLPDPQAMFDIHYFRRDPRPFFKFAKEIYPGQFSPSPSHKFIQLLEKQNRLLRNYSQNIDTLEHAAGIKNVITCHGSFATATCTICRHKVDSSVIKEDIFSQRIPYCPSCPPETGIMKPDIVFFGEGLSDAFHEALAKDKDVCDLLLVMGSSLKVRPVAMIPSSIPTNVPQILINREPLKHLTFDVELLGDCDVIIGELCKRLSPEWCTEDIPRSHLREVPAPPPRGSEVNNNVGAEESNSCDCGGLSAICLEDDASGAAREDAPRPEEEETQTGEKEVPEHVPSGGSYLFFPPSRYVFEGAEVYGEDAESEDEDDSSGSPTDYSSDASPRREDERPPAPPSEDSADGSPRIEDAPPSGDSRPAT
ncbi:NAD-dependent protein deacetylase sirtuin-1-like [Uloborus diversus]|uniref:NAD-dependent protein deacetylase sirtuin-1-like n=1 Tax=Uloborus diversus TaxID=327109 RepID=UPI002409E375|nr:NAD-dependent protein deacetylase sirtuin-1-like [Uloborus diversus]